MFPTEQEWMKNQYRNMVQCMVMQWSNSHKHREKHTLEVGMIMQDESYANGRLNIDLIYAVKYITQDFHILERLV